MKRITEILFFISALAGAFSCSGDGGSATDSKKISFAIDAEPLTRSDGTALAVTSARTYDAFISGAGGSGYAAIPHPAVLDGGLSAVRIPAPSCYRLDLTPGYDNIPMCGTFLGTTLFVRHLGGAIDVPVIGGASVRSIQFTSLDRGKSICGVYTADLTATEAASTAVFEGEGRSITLESKEPLRLNYSDTLHLFIPVPPGQYGRYELAFELEGSDPLIIQEDRPLCVSRGSVAEAPPVRLGSSESLISFSFKAEDNPNLRSDVHFDIDHDAAEASARIEYYAGLASMTASFEVPEGFKVYVNGKEQTSGVSVHNFYAPLTYTVTGPDALSKDYTVSVSHFTGLPVLIIDTPDGADISSKDEWTEDVRIRIDGVGRFQDFDGGRHNMIKGRGNATWKKFPKKPYNFKLETKHEILGMPAHRRWSLIANYRDRTRIRNRLTYHIADNILDGLVWTTRNEWVEVILNGQHKGFYLLCEQVKTGKNRVDITEFDTDEEDRIINLDLSPETITGGYLFQIDSYFDEPFKFRTKYKSLPIEFKYPNDNVPQEMIDWCKGYFDQIEELLEGKQFRKVYDEYIDLDSFVDFWIMAELAGNNDAGRPGSDYAYKDRGGKLFMGPVWDYDAFTYIHLNYRMNNALWYSYLLKDPVFATRAREHWEKYRPLLLAIPDWLDTELEYLKLSEKYEEDLWVPMTGFDSIQGDEFYTWPQSTSQLKKVFLQRMELMDRKISEINQ